MTMRNAKVTGLASDKETNDETVGYRRPPVASRFKPGQSGNPNGRPKKKQAPSGVPHMSEERMKDIVQEEAYRTISVREGDKLVEIPVVQAILRGVALSAAKGDARAQRAFTELLKSVEADKKALHDEYLKTAIEYKFDWTKVLKHCEEKGIEPPELTPHPDDIHINLNTGRVEIKGPMTPEDKKIWDEIKKRKESVKESIAELKDLLAKDPENKAIAASAASQQRILKMITERVPD